ncbi:nucleotide exchange factor GrpE [Geothermobacter hydrogeniphilus]|uniref:nucleotide exchange factor GrpE n=1 Tax=Geothermobacter hydrogeniphilus TaxID=1969733 RepID=UPI001E2C621C|nr:nucleotide exchange factor GrpE [Geothermobacter hydrogeniphilus]
MAKKKVTKQQNQEPEEKSTEDLQPGAETEEVGAQAATEDLAAELAAAREEAGKNWDLYLRSQAEMENFRKRMQRDKQDALRFANEGILREILPVIDNLERAVEHARENDTDTAGLLEGVEMTLDQFARTLEKFGVKPVDAVGKPFDPACHEAMGQMVTGEVPPNSVVQQLQKGYLLNERLLRPALVMVAKAPEVETEQTSDSSASEAEEKPQTSED